MITQYVKVDLEGKAYTYAWNGAEPLEVGDQVILPANWLRPKDFTGRVVRLLDKPDYDGPITRILDRVEDLL